MLPRAYGYIRGSSPRIFVNDRASAAPVPYDREVFQERQYYVLLTEEGMVGRVADGDTLTVITANQTKLRIRMLGIDAPETPKGTKFPGQPYGPEAEAYLKRLVDGKRVTVEMYGDDRYKRLLSTMFIDRKDINPAMIEVGLAEVDRGPESCNPYRVQYQATEETARAAKKGMWVLGDRYESPRAYRKRVGIS